MLRRVFALAALFCCPYFGADSSPLVTAVDSIGMTVSSLERSVEFYSKVLTFRKVAECEEVGENAERLRGVFGLRVRTARMRLGDEFIELTEYLTPRGRPAPVDQRSNDRWFQHIAIIVSDMDAAYRWLREHGVQYASPEPQRLPDWNKNAGGIQAFYFRDPDGHPLEILAFPPGKGDPKWHRPSKELFLGIDHTAIVVEGTEASLNFYRNLLGLRVAGESENYGPEQERLNNVFGARLRITSLRAGSGPGVEFLEYLTPRTGRSYPADAATNDLIHWETRFSGASAEKAAQRLRDSRAPFISTGVVRFLEGNREGLEAVAARDPDGHAVVILSGN